GGSCARSASPAAYSDGSACGSLNAAYQAASGGDVVLIKGGSYGSQTIADRGSLGSPVVFHMAPGETMTINGGLNVDGHDITIDGGDTLNKDETNRITTTDSLNAQENAGQGDSRNIVF